MRGVLLTLATAVSTALLACGVAVADTTAFEGFALGTVHNQFGWHSAIPGNVPALPFGYDQSVVNVSGIPGFGTKSLRHSNAYNEPTGEFKYQTYSRSTTPSAGEDANTEYVGEFSFISSRPDAQQPGLFMTMSPDDGVGGRMSGVRLIDEDDGIRAVIFDTPNPTTGKFESYDAGLYSRDEVHTVKFWIKFVPGSNNDITRIFIDGNDIGNQLGVCFTTWENFYRATDQDVPVTNSIIFRAAGGQHPNLVDGGFLFDNVSNTTGTGRGPLGCGEEPPPIVIDKTTKTRFVEPGGLITYKITVRNRSDAPLRAVRACDRPPRALRFLGASRRLHRAAGPRLCLTVGRLRPGQRRTFHATFRVRANVRAGTVINNGGSVDRPSGSAPAPVVPDSGVLPRQRRRVLDTDVARSRVRSFQACSATVVAHAAC